MEKSGRVVCALARSVGSGVPLPESQGPGSGQGKGLTSQP